MRKRRQIELFSISFLDLLSGALGAVIILYVAIPKNKPIEAPIKDEVKELMKIDLAKKDLEIKELRAQLSAVDKTTKEESEVSSTSSTGMDFDVGFKFKGKRIVFIIDTSYSMTEEDRMGQVKAGLKMLLTALSDDFKIEVIRYPLGERAPFKSMWGDMKEMTEVNKHDAFEFVYGMRPYGGTPTRDVLMFALQNYQSATDIVLLTDGVPTLHNSNKKDDIFDILENVRGENRGRSVRISAIGVGSDFIKDKTNDRYKFLSLLAQENDGFFVGF